MSHSLWSHGMQHGRLPCPSPSPGVHSNSCPWSRWCYPAISSSVVPFSSCPNPSQHQGLFQWVDSLCHVAKVHRIIKMKKKSPITCLFRDKHWQQLVVYFQSLYMYMLGYIHMYLYIIFVYCEHFLMSLKNMKGRFYQVSNTHLMALFLLI